MRNGLSSRPFELDEEAFVSLRALAFATGAVVERDGCCVIGLGRAAAFRLPLGLRDAAAVDDVRVRLERCAGPGAGEGELPIGVGALAFLPDEPGEIFLPELTLARGDGRTTAIAVAGAGQHEAVLERYLGLAAGAETVRDEGSPPDGFRLESARSHADFLERVGHAVAEVRSGRLDKVVLAREVIVEANRPFRQADLLERLRSLHPSCTTFCVEGFLGASPELLVRRKGAEIASVPLAGTAARSGDPEADRLTEAALLSSDKERAEHRAVVDAIVTGLAPVMASLAVPAGPDIVELRNVSHLRTRIEGMLAPHPSTARFPSALEVLALIHPTPAVSGFPIDVALEYLAKSEELDRGRYAGPVGWMRADGDGEFHLGIRSATVDGSIARLFAGVGIVADSDPAAELRETQLKLQALLAAAVRP